MCYLCHVYLKILCPCLYVPTRVGVNHRVIGIETPRLLQGRSSSLWAPDVDISRKHRLQIEFISTYHILRGTAYPINHIPRRPWGWSQCRDCVRNSSWQAFASYKRTAFLARLWRQTCFSLVMLQTVCPKSKKLSVFQDCNIMPWRPS